MSTEQQRLQGAHLVGSVTTESAAQTFTVASEHLGAHLRRIPDGEVGRRFHWIMFQGAAFEQTPGLARVGEEPVLLAGFDVRPFTLDGTIAADDIHFPELGYAEAALDSYRAFGELREAGTIRAGTRFQVSLPTPLAPVSAFVVEGDRSALEPAYTAALLREIAEITAAIPAADLAIQFDLAVEFAYLETAAGRKVSLPQRAWFEPVLDGLAQRAAAMVDAVPPGVEVGLHLCYGDVGERHFVEPLDTANLAAMANAIAAKVSRPLTWLHLPVPIDRDDEAYFRPLTGLAAAFEELYLGVVHHQDGLEGARARIQAATGVGVRPFGVGTECGFGRGPAERTVPLLQLHASLTRPWPEATT